MSSVISCKLINYSTNISTIDQYINLNITLKIDISIFLNPF